ncbi:MAG TPA: hypothetical protein VGG85_09400 [Terracidiphilus sp.]|jgi:hypothetical protein
MRRLLLLIAFAGTALGAAQAQTERPEDQSAIKSAAASSDLPPLPPAPRGKSTILGGEIRTVDPVLDQFSLRVFGQKTIKILYDERTQVFRDGNRIALRDLHPEAHASVQTILDGGNVYALSIHMLSQTPEGEAQGHILAFNSDTGELTLSSSLSREPIKLLVRPDTHIVRQGQSAFTSASSGMTDLVNGALVSIVFESNKQGRGVATHITVLARPGSSFVFSGNLTSFDLHAGILVLVDPRDQQSYQIAFDPAVIPAVESLHNGDHVRVTASFDGTLYTAQDISVSAPQ